MRAFPYFLMTMLIFITLGGCASSSSKTPKNFAFEFRYGVDAKNVLDTFNNKYTRDMVLDKNVTIDFKLTKLQLAQIYTKIIEIDFFDYPDNFAPKYGIFFERKISPYSTYYLKVKAGKISKVFRWEDEQYSQKIEAKKVRELLKLIIQMVEESPEYKKLPPPRGAYL